MADQSRPASFLPTIKCSNCSQEIEIAMMGEHVCSTAPPDPKPAPSRAPDTRNDFLKPTRTQEYGGSNFLKPGRRDPPRIDPSAANRPYLNSNSNPYSSTPAAKPVDQPIRSPFEKLSDLEYSLSRSPPSPPRSNTNNRLPSFPVSSSSQNAQPYKSAGERRLIDQTMDESNPHYAPKSPSFNSGGNVLKRMNTIAPGPFAIKGSRAAAEDEKQKYGHQRNVTGASTSSNESGSNRSTLNRQISDANPMLKRSQTERAGGFSNYKDSESRTDYGRANMPRGPDGRSQTFPRLRDEWPGERSSSKHLPKPTSKFPASSSAGSLADEYLVGNPYHAPSESQSSNGSYGSEARTGSSRSSPPLSESSGMGSRKPSRTHNLDSLMDNLQESISTSPVSKSLPSASRLQPERRPWADSHNLESPVDPRAKGGYIMRESPLPSPAFAPKSAPSQRLAPPVSKGSCRGCGDQIYGKSMSSSDGRLTGRYHKECFVCKSCSMAFETSEFYILNNQPYCARHYHKLNNSLCQSCDRGIEGQYLETDKKQKFHPRCLTCQECRQTLQDDYFELNDKIYCERHAMYIAQQSAHLGPGRQKNPERRKTRMMMMTMI